MDSAIPFFLIKKLYWSWLTVWKMKANGSKSTHITFTTRRGPCPPVHINNVQLPQTEEVKYVGMHLDRRLTWHKTIFTKRKQLGVAFNKMYWLHGRKSKLSINNKLLIYKTVLQPIWTYGIRLCVTASTSNIEVLERFQSKSLRMKLILNLQKPPGTRQLRNNLPIDLPTRFNM
jgi:hypothetical protein